MVALAEFDQADRLRVVVLWAEIAPEPLESMVFAGTEVDRG